MLTYDEYVSASSLDEAFDALDRIPGARIVAGATDLLPWAREGRAGDVHLPALVDVSAIAELGIVNDAGDRIQVGAAVPLISFEEDARLVAKAQVLGRCAVWFADDQIREQATLGGNIVNASPAGDSLPALLAMNAGLVLVRRVEGALIKRRMMLAEFITGPGKTQLLPREILLRVEFDPTPGYGASFEKVGHRRSLAISTVCMAALARLDANGAIDDVRVAIGAVGPVPERLVDAERALAGTQPDAANVREIAEQTADRVRSRSRQAYRREVLVNFVERGLIDALRRAGASIERLEKEMSNV
ncbi:molybdopterin dehydrogenase [Caballeronia hypogeia]|uniref:Molybdopterin dehydrogenase n=1 Tax=Caballeronia hypogeia TaxID=1777140 RepID=A0A157ZKV9_9BURK|nr:FAD binding domain-containing protein [Caballeronia hypogeia]SAK46152.1 molybdopterin dehydrogenase [Caballeronia hypogeia]